jgi:hypothetical protein
VTIEPPGQNQGSHPPFIGGGVSGEAMKFFRLALMREKNRQFTT